MRTSDCRLRIAVLIIALVALGFVSPAFAGDYGRVKGRVVDSETGVPVIGAAIEVEGTDYGASTDENGEYLVPAVPGGVQTLTASAVGYEPQRLSNVLVILDQTVTQNFRMKSTAIIINKPVEATARRTLTPTQTSTARAMTTAEFGKMPVGSLAEIVALQAGVVIEPSRGMHLRGGRPDEIAYYVDGTATSDPLYGYQAARVNPEATAEVVVISGGFDAEYGEAMSGVVQVITKEGKEKIAGRAKYTTDAFLPQGSNFGFNQIEASLGGPLGSKRLRYFISPELRMIGDYSPRSYRIPHQGRHDYKVGGKLAYNAPVGQGMKFTASGFHAREQWDMYPADPESENQLGYKYNLDHYLSQRNRLNKADLAMDHMLSKDIFYTVRAGYFYDTRTQAVRDLAAEEAANLDPDRFFWQDFKFKAEDSVLARDSVVRDLRAYYEEQKNDNCLNPYGVTGLYYGSGDYRTFLMHWSTVGTVKGDVTWNYQKTHEFKGGLEVRQNWLSRRYNSLPSSSDPFWDMYDLNPTNAAAYVQDRMDFDDLVIRAGLRLDYLDPAAYLLTDPTNREDTTHIRASEKYKLSPRLGVSFPISDRMKFRFSYGHFFQTPAFRYLFETISSYITRGNMIIGNPNLSAQQTVAYELGMEAELTRILSADFTAYYKDIYDLIGTRYQAGLPMGYFPYQNEEYGNVRGFEIAFSKAMHDYWSARLGYSLSMARGTSSYSAEWYYEQYRYQMDPVTGQPMEPPRRDYFLDFDERNTLRADIGTGFPRDFSVPLLRDFNATLMFSYGSGLPYSQRELKSGLNSGRAIGEKFSARMAPRYSVDSRLSKGFRVGPLALNLVCDITNLLNTKNVEWVYGFSGLPYDDGLAATLNPSQWEAGVPITVTSGSYHPARDMNHDGFISAVEEYTAYKMAYLDFVDHPNNYGAPRQIRFGVSLEF